MAGRPRILRAWPQSEVALPLDPTNWWRSENWENMADVWEVEIADDDKGGQGGPRQMKTILFVMALLVLSLAACSPRRGGQEGSSSDIPVRPPVGDTVPQKLSEPPNPPSEFRYLSPDPLPNAVKVLGEIEDAGRAVAMRAQLAVIYHDAGFYGASRFFQNSSRVASGKPINLSPVESPIGWASPKSDVAGWSLDKARAVHRLVLEGKYPEAAALAKKDLGFEPGSAYLVVEWADATLWETLAKPKSVGLEALEPALRIYLTSMEEQVTRPLGMQSRAGGYGILTGVFLRRGDRYSSLTAAVTGVRVMGMETGPEEDPGSSIRSTLCREAASLKTELGFPKNLWVSPEDPQCKPLP